MVCLRWPIEKEPPSEKEPASKPPTSRADALSAAREVAGPISRAAVPLVRGEANSVSADAFGEYARVLNAPT